MRRTKPSQFTINDRRFPANGSETVRCESSILICCLAVLLLGTLPGGCTNVTPRTRGQQQIFYAQELSAPYDQTEIKRSLTLDVLPKIQRTQSELGSRFAASELLSHSDRVVASSGQSEDGHVNWFNMVAFHEYRLSAVRKYFFMVDDTAWSLQTRARRGLRFDSEMVLEENVLNESYASESARQVALLKYVLGNVHKDVRELVADVDVSGQSNKVLNVCGMLINQTIETVLLKLDSSPILATRLGEVGGIEFDHITFDKGRIRMVVMGDVVTVKVRVGAFAREMEDNQ